MSSQDPRSELADIAASVRALIEQHEDAGSPGLPTDGPPEALLAAISGGPAPRGLARAPQPSQGPPQPREPAPAPVAPPRFAEPPQRREAPKAAAAPAAAAAPSTEDLAPDERRMRLALLAEASSQCTRCVLHEQRKQAVFSRGDPFAELCFVGEGPGADEDAQGEPFVGMAGQLLDKMIAAMGHARDAVYICNIVKCRPPNNRNPEPDEIEACSSYLTGQLALVRPKVIVALGAVATRGLTGSSEGITRARGKWKLYKGKIAVMPTFHPAYLLRQPAAKRDVWNDLQEVMRFLERSSPRAAR